MFPQNEDHTIPVLIARHVKILKVKKVDPCRGNLPNWNRGSIPRVIARNFGDFCRTLCGNLPNWNKISGLLREIEATTTVLASNFFQEIATSPQVLYRSKFLQAIRNDVANVPRQSHELEQVVSSRASLRGISGIFAESPWQSHELEQNYQSSDGYNIT